MSIAPIPSVPLSRSERVFVRITMAAAAQFGWVFVMGLLAGGQFHHRDRPRWEAWVDWPVLPIPSWFTIALGVAGVVAALVFTRRRRAYAEFPVLFHDLALAILFLVGMPVFLALMYSTEEGWAAHWMAAPIQVITLSAIVARLVATSRNRPEVGA